MNHCALNDHDFIVKKKRKEKKKKIRKIRSSKQIWSYLFKLSFPIVGTSIQTFRKEIILIMN